MLVDIWKYRWNRNFTCFYRIDIFFFFGFGFVVNDHDEDDHGDDKIDKFIFFLFC